MCIRDSKNGFRLPAPGCIQLDPLGAKLPLDRVIILCKLRNSQIAAMDGPNRQPVSYTHLEQHDSVAPRCKAHRLPGPVIRLRVAAQPQKFPVMRGQHDRTGTSAQNIYMSRDGVYAIRVQNQRRAAAQQDLSLIHI